MSAWPAIELGKVAEIAAGGSAPQNSDDFGNVGTPFVRAGSLKPLTEGAVESSLKLLSEDVAKKHRLRLFPAGSVLFAKSGMSATKGLVYRLNSPAYVVNHLAAIISGPNLDSDYLRHCLQVFSPTCLIQDEAYPSIRLSDIASMKIPLPPLGEQKLITDILDRVEALRTKRLAALTRLDELVEAIFIDMFGDPVTNSKRWPIKSLGEVAQRITKGESPKWQGFDYQEDGALFVTSENVRLGEIDLSCPKYIPLEFHKKLNRSELKRGDLLVNLVGASIGRSCVFPGFEKPANVNQAVGVITLKSEAINITFIVGLLTSQKGQKLLLDNKVEAARANISLTNLRELKIPFPPLSLQREFARHIEAIDKLKQVHKTSLAKLDELFASLQYRAFRGELGMIPKTTEQSFEGVKI
ncbi:restriction endonuclease subunit S [Methanosarcina sp.]|uniref:restriction endonuclease subunit S n=1 Tax=Methanosarcina sp. TaxID=2213 RepID=UPI003C72235F